MRQQEIAKRLGVSPQAVSKWYKGLSLPNYTNLAALSRLLGTDIETLMKDFQRRKAQNMRSSL